MNTIILDQKRKDQIRKKSFKFIRININPDSFTIRQDFCIVNVFDLLKYLEIPPLITSMDVISHLEKSGRMYIAFKNSHNINFKLVILLTIHMVTN